MAHLIEPIYEVSIDEAIRLLQGAHASIVDCVIATQLMLTTERDSWGVVMKRLEIDVPFGEGLVGKSEEKYVEVINILATAERTVSALKWLGNEFPGSLVQECHASTSDGKEGNDIVLVNLEGAVSVRCEVCDVVASKAGQNGKEKKDLKNLGCTLSVPDDNIRRFIATSSIR